MKILLINNTKIFIPHMAAAFWKSGFEVELLDVKLKGLFDVDFIKILSNALLNKKYDLVFSVNYYPIASMTCKIHNVKYISWVVDSPYAGLNSPTIENKCNYIFIFDKDLYTYYYNISPKTVFYMPLGANVSEIDKICLSDLDYDKYKCDVSFVGSLYKRVSQYDSINFEQYWQGYFDSLINAQFNMYDSNIFNDAIDDKAIKAFCKYAEISTDIKNKSSVIYDTNVKDLVVYELSQACTRLARIEISKALSNRFDFNLYTEETDTPENVINKGIVEPTIEAFKVYKASKINLNITSKNITSGLSLRIFDILAAKGFLITNYQPEILELYEPGKELVIYNSVEDLIEKINYYLQHEDERMEIAENGYRKTLRCHDYSLRILEILKIVSAHM